MEFQILNSISNRAFPLRSKLRHKANSLLQISINLSLDLHNLHFGIASTMKMFMALVYLWNVKIQNRIWTIELCPFHDQKTNNHNFSLSTRKGLMYYVYHYSLLFYPCLYDFYNLKMCLYQLQRSIKFFQTSGLSILLWSWFDQ